MNTAKSRPVARALNEPIRIGLNHSQDGCSETPATAWPSQTRVSATTEKTSRTESSTPSSAYCTRAETSMPR